MFNTLLESKRPKQKNLRSTITSFLLHGLLLFGAVVATRQAGIADEQKTKVEDMQMIKEKEPEPEPEKPPPDQPPPDVPNTPPPPKGFQVLQAPVDIPTVIPDIDLTKRVTNELDFSGKGVAGGVASGVVGGTGKVDSDQPYFSFEVEKNASMLPSTVKPAYPNLLKTMKTTGRVIVSFVVDTTGKADMSTFKVVESAHELFTAEVRKVLPKYSFIPAEIGNRKVPVYVQLPFEFTLDGGN